MIRIEEVSSRKDLRRFIKFPFTLYKDCPYWVPPLLFDENSSLDKKKNPALAHCDVKYWLAYNNGKVEGRIAGIINHLETKKFGKIYARFGWLDFTDNKNISKELFNKFEKWAKSEGAEIIHGPLGFTDMDKEGMLIKGFEEVGTMATIYNYPYYPEHIEDLGYEKKVDWVEYEVITPKFIPNKLQRYASIVSKRYDIKEIKFKNRKHMKSYAEKIFNIINLTYENLYGFIPLTKTQISYYTNQYFNFINPDFISILQNSNNDIVGFGITMPSFSKALKKCKGKLFPLGVFHLLRAMRKNTCADGYLIGILPEYQNKGLNAIMIKSVFENHIKFGIKKFESGIELQTNTKVQALWKLFEHRIHKRRRCFIKNI